MNPYPLHNSKQSPYCEGKYDEKSGKFLETNLADITACCIDSCKKNIDYCFDECKKIYKSKNELNLCQKKCKYSIDSCVSGCTKVHSHGLDNMKNCIIKYGCGVFPNVDMECIEKNRASLISCCHKDCDTGDCDEELCSDFYEHVVKPLQFPKIVTNIDTKSGQENNLGNFLIVFGVILLILSIVLILVGLRYKLKY